MENLLAKTKGGGKGAGFGPVYIGIGEKNFYPSKICHGALVHPKCFCYMQPRRRKSALPRAVVAELVDAQR
ncbi:hypothetical protein [Neorhizobium sp. 2083]|uniref:hypothetical protein n=1 Tax=Neorhizobium sp. 2083 TaxID=2817762 RepID=UPI00286B6ED4|nr:hypothetical protein [Neorhizobium sp. 2083]